MMLLRLFAQLPISLQVFLCFSLVDMCANLDAFFILILSYILDRRKLLLSKHKSENLFFLHLFMETRRDLTVE